MSVALERELPASGWQTAAADGAARLAQVPWIPLLILAVVLVMALVGDFIAPHAATEGVLADRLRPPAWESGGKATYMLGTDLLGRDILSRIIVGARISLLAAGVTVLLGGCVGTLVGLIAGYLGGWVDVVLMRLADAMLSLPVILLALLFAVLFGPSVTVVIAVLALSMWARFARQVRGEVLSLKERDYVALAKVAGCSTPRIIQRHILPGVLNPLVVLATLQLSWVVILEAGLSFLGAGIPPPAPSWGSMVAAGRDYIADGWWVAFFPGLAIVLLVLSLNLLGDWLRDALDPRMSGGPR